MNGMRRIFVAVKIPDKLRSEIKSYAGNRPEVSWVKPENLHVTVSFLGNIDDSRLRRTRLLARKVAEKFQPFVLTLGRPRVFGGRVVLFEMKSHEFTRLQNKFRGLPGKFSKPHLTLGRVSGQVENKEELLRDLSKLTGEKFRVGSIAVMESTFGKSGRVYTTVYEAKFKGRHVSGSR
jgi:2'-5' RNA ligase